MSKLLPILFILLLVGVSFAEIRSVTITNITYVNKTVGAGATLVNETFSYDADWDTSAQFSGGTSWSFNKTYESPFLNTSNLINISVTTKDRISGAATWRMKFYNYTLEDFQTINLSYITSTENTNTTLATAIYDYVSGNQTTIEIEVQPGAGTGFHFEDEVTIYYEINPSWNQTPTDQSVGVEERESWFYKLNASFVSNGTIAYGINNTDYFQIDSTNGNITTNATTNIAQEVYVFVNDTRGGMVNESITLTYIQDPLINCTTEVGKSITFFLLNETTDGILNGTIKATLGVTSPITANVSMDLTEAWNFTACLFPTTSTYTTDINIEYERTGYTLRRYIEDSRNLTSTQAFVNLFLLDSSLDTATTFTVNDNLGNNLENVILEAYKYDPGTNTYKLVETGRTGTGGEVVLNLQHAREYEYRVKREGNILLTVPKYSLDTATPETIIVITEEDVVTYTWHENFGVACTYTNTTKQLDCTILDNEGLTSSIMWQVSAKRNASSSWSLVCNESSAANPVTFGCNLEDDIQGVNSNVYYQITGLQEGKEYFIADDYVDYTFFYEDKGYGAAGALAAMLIIIVLGCAGLWNPQVSIAMVAVSMVVVYMLQLITIPYTALVGLIAMAFIIVGAMRK